METDLPGWPDTPAACTGENTTRNTTNDRNSTVRSTAPALVLTVTPVNEQVIVVDFGYVDTPHTTGEMLHAGELTVAQKGMKRSADSSCRANRKFFHRSGKALAKIVYHITFR